MKKNFPSLTIILLILFNFLTGCNYALTWGAPVIPIAVSVNSAGEINVGLAPSVNTPIGTFTLSGDTTVMSLRDISDKRLLIIRVDKVATVYPLEEGKEFNVEFKDNGKLYSQVNLVYEADGDIVLELESVNPASLAQPNSTPIAISDENLPVTCIHPDQIATQLGWKDSRIIDKFYGGYNVYVPNLSQLPALWEANYFGMDNVFSAQIKRDDLNRQMDIGTWIIYAPDECRSQLGFATSLTPVPAISSPSEIPNTVLCIHPEQLISQKSWGNLGILDKLDGGYKARISMGDTLPDYWEANRVDESGKLLRQIFYFDQDRRMDIGIWIIYTPPVKSCRDQFGFTIGGK